MNSALKILLTQTIMTVFPLVEASALNEATCSVESPVSTVTEISKNHDSSIKKVDSTKDITPRNSKRPRFFIESINPPHHKQTISASRIFKSSAVQYSFKFATKQDSTELEDKKVMIAKFLQIGLKPGSGGNQKFYAVANLKCLGSLDSAAIVLRSIAKDPTCAEMELFWAADELQKLGLKDEAIELYRKIIGCSIEDSLKFWVANALGELKCTEDAVAIYQTVGHHASDIELRLCAADSLRNLGYNDFAAAVYLELLHSYAAEDIRLSAIYELQKYGVVTEAEAAYRDIATNSNNIQIKCCAAEGLGKIGKKEEAASILRNIYSDPSIKSWQRFLVIESLERLGQRAEATAMLRIILTHISATVLEKLIVSCLLTKWGEDIGVAQIF